MARKRVRTIKEHYDGPHYPPNDGPNDGPNDDDRFNTLGILEQLAQDFLRDKAALERKMDTISAGPLKPEYKKAQLEALKIELAQLQEDYQKRVSQERERLFASIKETTCEQQKTIDQLEEQEDDLRAEQSALSFADTSSAADKAKEQKDRVQQCRDDYIRQLEDRIEQAKRQEREMLKKRLSGGGY